MLGNITTVINIVHNKRKRYVASSPLLLLVRFVSVVYMSFYISKGKNAHPTNILYIYIYLCLVCINQSAGHDT